MATASVTLSLNNSAFLAGMARARASVSSLGSAAAGIAGQGIAYASAAVVALGTATAIGLKKAFDFGGKLADMSAISGRSAKSILLLRRALEDAGVSMEKIDRYILTGQDRGQVIARALENITAGDWADAAASIGTQANLLEQNAATFDRVSDLMGRAGDKLRGFFVGAASSIGKALLPILEKFDKMDFAAQGQKFGDGLLMGARALVGFFQKPELIFGTAIEYFSAGIFGIGNVLIAVFKAALEFFKDGMFEALVAIGSAMTSVFLKAFQAPITKLRQAVALLTTGQAIPTDKASYGIEVTANDLREQSKQYAGFAIERAKKNGFKIEDVFGAGNAFTKGQAGMTGAAKIGRSALPEEMAAAGRQKLEDSYKAQELIRSQIAVSGGSGINEAMFSKNAMASEDEFASRWGMPKPSESGKGKGKSEEILSAIDKNTSETAEITRKAWGQ